MQWINIFILLWTQVESMHRIIGGDAAKPGEFPYLVYIRIGSKQSCTGSLISPQWVLTAAHCTGESMTIFAGHPDRTSEEAQVRKSIQVIQHPDYTESRLGLQDIALVKVKPFNMSSKNIGTLKLSGKIWPQDQQTARKCIATGWGLDSNNRAPDVLRHIAVVAQHGKHVCPCVDQEFLQKRLVCLKPEVGNAPCFGDSGGPLICDGEAVGVTHLALAVQACKPWSTEVAKIVCGNKETVVFYMYICPQLTWIHKYVTGVPEVPESCKATNSCKPAYFVTFLYSFIFLIQHM